MGNKIRTRMQIRMHIMTSNTLKNKIVHLLYLIVLFTAISCGGVEITRNADERPAGFSLEEEDFRDRNFVPELPPGESLPVQFTPESFSSSCLVTPFEMTALQRRTIECSEAKKKLDTAEIAYRLAKIKLEELKTSKDLLYSVSITNMAGNVLFSCELNEDEYESLTFGELLNISKQYSPTVQSSGQYFLHHLAYPQTSSLEESWSTSIELPCGSGNRLVRHDTWKFVYGGSFLIPLTKINTLYRSDPSDRTINIVAVTNDSYTGIAAPKRKSLQQKQIEKQKQKRADILAALTAAEEAAAIQRFNPANDHTRLTEVPRDEQQEEVPQDQQQTQCNIADIERVLENFQLEEALRFT